MSDQLLELRDVTMVYRKGAYSRATVVALDGVSLGLPPNGGAIAIAGESGSGKSTIARLLLGFAEPTRGRVIYRGQDVRSMTRQERLRFRREVQPIFQDPFDVFNPFYRVDHGLVRPLRRFDAVPHGRTERAVIEEALEAVGLRPSETLGRYPHELSGGQRQRIMIARALLLRPHVIVADEPVSMVDASLRATILEQIRMLRDRYGMSIAYVTHDLTTAYQVCERIVILYQGRIVESGSVAQVIVDPKHPYTQLLVSSIPSTTNVREWNEGNMPVSESTGVVPRQGCGFAPRCRFVVDECRVARPPMVEIAPSWAAACIRYGPEQASCVDQPQ